VAKVALPPGRYVVAAELWRFGGEVDSERIAFAGMSLDSGRSIADDDAELLLLSTAAHGQLWAGAAGEVATGAVAEACERRLVGRLQDRFDDEARAREAEQRDRASIQLRTLDRRCQDQGGRLRAMIEQQRRDQRVKASVIAANEGRLRKLEETIALRRAEIERRRGVSRQREALAVAIVDVP
jgi:hypothetical protein